MKTEKFIAFEKLSKKDKRRLNNEKRGTWGALNPVTRVPANPKAYNRAKLKRRMDYEPFGVFGIILI
ncbi:MAG: hypothetical protein LBM98_09410 [Oscillospiraceae bacterium]|jgi:hypothetical protein|nr:hypothetical protein [Oscillospiraceae bacterium]